MKRIVYSIFFMTLFLISLGVVMVYSTSAILAQEKFGDGTFFLKKELLWLCFGIIALYIAYRVPYPVWVKISPLMLLASIGFLFLVMIPGVGHQVGGARRWLKFGGFGFQPSEFAKYAMIVFLARWISNHQDQIKSFTKGFLPPILVLGFTVGIILIQPDLGTAVGLGTVGLVLLFVGGVRIRYLIALLITSIPVLYFFVAGVAYRRARILAFLDPWKDPKGVGFQIIQSFIALGSGGLTGVGLGESRQKLFYLPEAHTDFIFSIIGEELGFIGALIVCLAFFALFYMCFRVASKMNDLTGHLIGLGIATLLTLQTVVNIGVVTGTLPTKGLPLPFISFGGSSLVFSMAGIGIVMNLARSLSKEVAKGDEWRSAKRMRVKPRVGRRSPEGVRRLKGR